MKLLASLAVLATLAGCKSSWPEAPAPIPAHEFMPGLQPARIEYSLTLCAEMVPLENGEFELRNHRCRWLPIEEVPSQVPASPVAADLMFSALRELPCARRAGLVEFTRSDARIAHSLESFDFEQAFEILSAPRER